ncbi:MAG: hypothetical protein ACO1OG_06975 [Devosia sp.]
MNDRTLVRHDDIQKWATAHRVQPAVRRIHDGTGGMRSRLTLRFEPHAKPDDAPGLDEGLSPVSWTAWLAELDRQNLALRIKTESRFELVDRRELN